MNFLEYLYYLGLSAKKYVALKSQKRLPFRVISLGNITLGGTGKTPAAIAVAEEAKKRGLRPVILTRGYKGTAQGPCFVTKGEKPLLSAEQAGDEPFLMAERLEGVPIVKGADRYEAGMFALQHFNSQLSTLNSQLLFILDDGFQHWRLYRDRDVVLIDSRNPFGNRRLFPVGRLREPLAGLGRADVIMITKAERQDAGLIAEIRRYNTHAPVFFSEHRVVAVRSWSGQKTLPACLQGRKVFCFCGLADPESFRNTVAVSGAEVLGMKAYPDHHLYGQRDIDAVRKECASTGASWIITTDKDRVKLRNLDLPENILIIEIAFSADQTFFDSVFA